MDDQHALTIQSTVRQRSAQTYDVTISGELDLDSAIALTEELDRLLADGATDVVLEASGVEFMDSSGLRAIIGANKRLEAHGGRLTISGLSGAARRVLEITGLLDEYVRGEDD